MRSLMTLEIIFQRMNPVRQWLNTWCFMFTRCPQEAFKQGHVFIWKLWTQQTQNWHNWHQQPFSIWCVKFEKIMYPIRHIIAILIQAVSMLQLHCGSLRQASQYSSSKARQKRVIMLPRKWNPWPRTYKHLFVDNFCLILYYNFKIKASHRY